MTALAPGCFASTSIAACSRDGAQVAVGGTSPPASGRLALLRDDGDGSSALSSWTGMPSASVDGAVPTFLADGFGTVDFRPELALLGATDLRFYAYDRASGSFGSAGGLTCASLPGASGIGSGDMDASRSGDEALVVTWSSSPAPEYRFNVVRPLEGTSCNLGSPEATHGAPPAEPLGGFALRPAVVDLDGDGASDGAVPLVDESGSAVVLVLWSDGAGGIAETEALELGDACLSPGDALAFDVDLVEDGLPDLVVGCRGTTELQIFLGRPGRTFLAAPAQPTGLRGTSADLLALGSVNLDGLPDLLSAERGAAGRRCSSEPESPPRRARPGRPRPSRRSRPSQSAPGRSPTSTATASTRSSSAATSP